MRVIAGEWRARRVDAPKGDLTRPTADRTRETLFSMLTSRLGTFDGLHVADLFAGSGALGIEALSRGAGHCLFIENDRRALETLRANLSDLGAIARSTIDRGSVMAMRPARKPVDLILLDPPYRTGAGEVALERLMRLGWIGDATWIALETAFNEEPDIKGLTVETTRKVGKARITLLQRDKADAIAS